MVSLICLTLAAITFAAYWPVVGHGFVNYDDDDYVTDNLHVKRGLTASSVTWAFTTFHEANWHPLTWISHMLDVSLFGQNAGGHHATNLLLHIASTILLFLAMRRMTGFVWRSAFVAALFAVHPLHVESVAWVAERKDVLSTFFLMLTLLAYARYAERPGIGRYLLVAGAFALGLMSKPMLVTLPVILLLLDWWPLGRLWSAEAESPDGASAFAPVIGCRPKRKLRELRFRTPNVLIEKLPLFAMAASSGVITFVAQDKGLTVGSLEHYPTGVRVANALVAYVTYLVRMVWPVKLAVFYPHPGTSLPVWQVIGSAVLLIGITALVLRVRRRHAYLTVGWLWYLVMLLPVIGLVQVGMQAMADRYTYVPLVGVFVATAWLIGQVGRVRLVGPLAALIVIGCTVGTRHQAGYWKDSETLFRHALAVTKDNAVAENNLGLALMEEGEHAEGIRHIRCAVEINPGWADARYSLGAALLQAGQAYDAVPEFEAALAVCGDHAQAHQNMGAALIQLGDVPRAVEHLKRAIEVRPDYAQAHNNLGTASSYQGKWDDAVRHWTKATRLDPYLADAHYNLAIGLAQRGNTCEAIRACRKALALEPESATTRNNLAWLLATTPGLPPRDRQEAVRLAEGICESTSHSDAQYLDTLAAAYKAAGRREDALRAAEKALTLMKK